MSQPPVPGNPDPSQLRVSDEDRHRVAEVLREAAGEGRISMDELDQRLEATYAAKTYGDLVPITVDLPASRSGASVPAVPPVQSPARREVPRASDGHESSLAIMSTTKRLGAWVMPPRHTASSLMGEVRLDLRQATFAARESVIIANAVMGSVKIVVDAYTRVIVDGTAIMGEFGQKPDVATAELGDDSPVVRIKGFALMGEVSVVRWPAPGTPRKHFGTY
jgi:hypothetical protein